MKKYLLFIILLGLHLFLLVNLRFTAWPETISFPYYINNGFKFYGSFVNAYTPILTLALTFLYRIFGYNLPVLKIFTWSLILTSDVLIYLIIKKIANKKLAVVGLLFYVLTQPFLEGNQLWYELAMVPPILLGICFLFKNNSNWNIFLAGLFLGIAVLVKQNSIVYLLFCIPYLLYRERQIKKILIFLIGPSILALSFIGILFFSNSLIWFLNWIFVYPMTFWKTFPGYVQMTITLRQTAVLILLAIPLLWSLIVLRKRILKDNILLLSLGGYLISFILFYPRFGFLHFQSGLTFYAIFLGILLSRLKIRPIIIFLYGLTVFGLISVPVIKADWQKETRFWSNHDLQLAKIIQEKTAGPGRIYLLGLNSNYYTFMKKLPPKPWMDNFGWCFEYPGMQKEVIADWSKDNLKNIVIVDAQPGNWYDLGTYQPKEIIDWVKQNYVRKEELEKGIWLWQIK